MANEYKGVSGIYALKFYEDLATLGAAETITPAGGYTDQDLCSPFAGSIVGIAAEHHTTSTVALTITVYAGATAAGTVEVAAAADSDNYATFQPGTYPVAIDDDITVKASLASGSTTDDYGETSVWVFVQIGSSAT